MSPNTCYLCPRSLQAGRGEQAIPDRANETVDDKQTEHHLSSISTVWTMLRKAHGDSPGSAAIAWQELMQRDCGAAYRYLLRAVRDPHVAEDLSQEFALRFIRGRFRHADPGRGRFRDYVKSALFNLVHDHRRRQAREPRPGSAESEVADPPAPPDDSSALRYSVSSPDVPSGLSQG